MDWQRARRPEQKAIRRQEILAAAYALFVELDYEEISLNAIARKAGISKPNVYRYFSTREEIFLQILLDTFQAWAKDMRSALARIQRPARPDQVAELWTRITRAHPKVLRLAPWLMTSLERHSSAERLYAFKRAMFRQRDRVGEALRHAMPSLSQEDCRQILRCAHGLIAGLGPATCPNDVLVQVMSRPALAGQKPDFDRLMTTAMTALLAYHNEEDAGTHNQDRRTNVLYREMPTNGDRLSILGFGCMRLPEKDGTIDEERATSQIRRAIDAGVNYVDTAWPYHAGQSEPFLGRALADGYRQRVKLATKLPSWMVHERGDMDRFLDAQLERLQTDHIDYYLIHCLVGDLWDKIETLGVMDFLDQAKADGRIVNAGFSFHGAPDEFTRIVDAYPWDFCQIQYNYLDEENQAGTKGLEYAAAKGLGVIVMEPLRGGKLAAPIPDAVAAIWKKAKAQRTPVEWALRWIWNRPEVTVVLSGMNDDTHIDENLKIAAEGRAHSLSDAELSLVGRVEETYRRLMKAGCTGCRYCVPCPAGVGIPVCFELYNNLHMFADTAESKFMYAARLSGTITTGKSGYASQCVNCGQCLEKCPQHLDIPALLESVANDLEGPDLKEREAAIRKVFAASAT